MSAQDQHTKFKHHKLTAEQEAKLRSVIGFSFSGSDGVSSSGKGKESMSETHPDMDVDDKSDGVSSMPVDRASGCKRQCIAGRADSAARSAESLKGECIVCWEDMARVALIPCGHVCLCLKCAPQQRICPMCRRNVSDTLQVYFSTAMQ